MRNIEIVTKAMTALAAEGTISSITRNDTIIPTEGIYTKNAWRRKGFRVNKEESPIVTLPIFIYTPNTVSKGDGQTKRGRMLCVRANFYKMSQVTEINKRNQPFAERVFH